MSEEKGNMVVYGKIYTAQVDASQRGSDQYKMAEAMVVKDKRIVFVGSKEEAQKHITADTQVIDYTDKGLIMPTCTNGHAHYLMGYSLGIVGKMIDESITDRAVLLTQFKEAVEKAKKNHIPVAFGFGWNYIFFKDNVPTRQELDAIATDIPIYMADAEGHKGVVNTRCLEIAGIMDKDGKVLKRGKDIRGGEIVMAADGTPTGLLLEQAGTYVRSKLDNEGLFPMSVAEQTIELIQNHLLAEGYTIYMDGWSNYFYNSNLYKAAQKMDEEKGLRFIFGMSHEIESWADIPTNMQQAKVEQQYQSKHVLPNWIKLFIDGTVEGGTGFVSRCYPDGHQGLVNWSEDEVADITRRANGEGLSMHIHTMGDAAVHLAVSAFVKGGQDEKRNTIVHVRNVMSEDWQRMADHNIYATSGMLWHRLFRGAPSMMRKMKLVPEGMEEETYPMRSYFKYGIPVTSSTDFPALSGSPDSPFGVMQIAVLGLLDLTVEDPWWPAELLTREQALQALTLHGAKQLFLENERGSLEVGKYADFILTDQNVLTCPVTKIAETKVVKTFFEGEEVYSL